MSFDHFQSIKEVLRNTLLRLGFTGAVDTLRRFRGRHVEHISGTDLANVFSDIYAKGVWVEHEGQTSLSGVGSVASATDDLRLQLSSFLKETDCRRVVDVGCGDFGWMKNIDGEFEYLGIDVVQSVIDTNEALYATPIRRFICRDATTQPIERWGDVVICREVLFHLSFDDALSLMRNIRSAGFKYILLTSDRSVWFNSDIRSGDYRRINLQKSPFNLPAPQRQLADEKVFQGRIIGIWSSTALDSI